MAEEQLVVFRLGKEEYALSISKVRDIIQYKSATKLPNSPAYLKGIINPRGKLISVIDIAVKFVLDIEEIIDRRVIIIDTDDRIFAIIVDEVTEVRKLQDSDTTSGATNYIRGVAQNGNRLIILLHVEKIVDSATLGLLENVS